MRCKIEGINCAACSTLILMALEENKFEGFSLSEDDQGHWLTVPEQYRESLSQIKQIVEEAGHYKLILETND